MKFNIVTLFGELFDLYLNFSVFYNARIKKLFEYNIVDLRDFGIGPHKKVDDYPYGGGKGMVLRCEPLANAVESIANRGKVIYFSPKGKVWNQKMAKEYALTSEYTLICGRYEGIDQRIIDLYVDEEISMGDFILTGSELPALTFIDSVCRHTEGFLEEDALKEESFEDGLLEYPHYTRPYEFNGKKVPDVLLSGHHKEIEKWRYSQKIELTKNKRIDLYKKYVEVNDEHHE